MALGHTSVNARDCGLPWSSCCLLLLVLFTSTRQTRYKNFRIDQLTKPDEDIGKYGPRSEYMIDEDE